ncbi:MAG: hypothetical protein Q4F00_13125 [bacterium]|nr:hypothetical protein [bacterium]
MFTKKRGTVLIMTMMAICLTFMMIHVLMQTTGYGLNSTSSFYDREAALQAAQSGVDYAVTRLQHHSGWRGDSNCKYWNDSESEEKIYGSFSNGLMTAESNGNVVGLIADSAGHISGFRIKFSYEDNSSATYDKVERSHFGQKDTNDLLPKQEYRIKSPYVSVNNLISKSATLVYRANSDGIGVAPTTRNLEIGQEVNDENREFAFHLPAQRLSLVVEGLAGKGLRDCKTPADINAAANGGANVVHRYVEAIYSDIAPVVDGDAAFAQDSISFDVKNKLFVSTNMQTYSSDASKQGDLSTVPSPGSLRSNNSSISVNGGKLNTYNGKLIRPKDIATAFNKDEDWYTFLDSEGKPQKYQFPNTAVEVASSKVEDIDWKNVAQADNKGDLNNVTPGFYQWHPAPNSTTAKPTYQLRYYKDGYELDDKGRPVPKNSASFQIAVTGKVENSDPGVEIDGKTVSKISIGPSDKVQFVTDPESGDITEPTLSLAGELFCNGNFTIGSDTATVTSVCPKVLVTSYKKASETAPAPGSESSGETEEANSENGVFTANGDIFIASSLFGSGAIVTEAGDVTFMGGSVLESGNCGVAIYGKNVTLKSLEGAVVTPPKGYGMDQDITQNPTGSNPAINEDGSMDITPGDDFFDYLHKSWQNNGCRTPKAEDIETYFSGLGANVSAGSICSADVYTDWRCTSVKRVYSSWLWVYDENSHSTKTFYFEIDENKNLVMEDHNYCPRRIVTSFHIPSSAVNIQQPELPEEVQKIADIHGSVCYGDQIFKGVIYARNNFKADLGDKFSLTVTGAIRAEKGKIEANCKGASLAYDETYLKTLLPSYSKLVCKMWNCW